MLCQWGIQITPWLIVAAGLLLAAIAEATSTYQPQRGDPLLERWRWTHFAELDGKGFRCMAETKDGSMWFGVQQGVIRYDGQQWTTYTAKDGLFDAPVTGLCAARDGSVWAATSQSIPSNLRAFKDGTWKSILPWGTNAPAISVYNIIESADGSIWASLGQMILRLRANDYTLYAHPANSNQVEYLLPLARFCPLPENVSQGMFGAYIVEDRSGRMWLASRPGPVACWNPQVGTAEDPKAWRSFDDAHGLHAEWEPVMLPTRDGRVLVGYADGATGLSAYDPGAGQWSVALSKIYYVSSILETRDGTLWVGSHDQLQAQRSRSGSWRVYESDELGISPNAMRLLEAADGRLWFGLQDGKVFRVDYSDRQWSSYQGLNFQADSADGVEWFLSVDGGVIRRSEREWTRYDVADGLMSDPVTLLCSKDGRTWAAGSHEGVAATAFFEDGRWYRQLHPQLSWTVDYRSAMEGSDGHLRFGANNEPMPGTVFQGGLASFQKSPTATNQWTYLHPPQTPLSVCGIAQVADGRFYYGGMSLVEQTVNGWNTITNPSELGTYWIDAVAASLSGDLWAARGGIGVFRRHDGVWTKFDVSSGLADLMVSTLLCSSDGTVWAATPQGISRFDGRSWTPHAFAAESIAIDRESGTLRQSRDGCLWINTAARKWYFRARTEENFSQTTLPGFRTIGYRPGRGAPDTQMKVTFKEVSQPGNTLIGWEGTDPWGATPANQLQFSYRFDDGDWSVYTSETEKMFLAMKSGAHTFEVRARDMDFNVDPTPAQFQFVVIPPVWKQSWFLGLMGTFLVVLGAMEFRVFRRNYRLRIEVDERKRAQTMVQEQKERLQEQNEELEAQKDELGAQKDQLVAHKERLELEIDQRKKAEVEVEKVHKQLLSVSRRAGMAEVATGVLHNVGNVLNSVNVSATLVAEKVQRSKAASIAKVATLLNEHATDLGAFMTQDEKGQKLPGYLNRLAEGIADEQQEVQQELASLRVNIDHIKEIVAMQQNYARVSGVVETVPVRELVEDALKMHSGAYLRHAVRLEREYGDVPPITTDKHKVLQILVNVLHNAKYACDESGRADKQVTVRVAKSTQDRVKIEVADNGIGILAENLARIFQQGFSIRKGGHGFGLHSGALAAKEMGGTLSVHSDGPGRGATFTLELPSAPPGARQTPSPGATI
jgi:signal transduction histidine kinase/ligand-binding sensor domain-containing protein